MGCCSSRRPPEMNRSSLLAVARNSNTSPPRVTALTKRVSSTKICWTAPTSGPSLPEEPPGAVQNSRSHVPVSGTRAAASATPPPPPASAAAAASTAARRSSSARTPFALPAQSDSSSVWSALAEGGASAVAAVVSTARPGLTPPRASAVVGDRKSDCGDSAAESRTRNAAATSSRNATCIGTVLLFC